jgi:hypothetical protein
MKKEPNNQYGLFDSVGPVGKSAPSGGESKIQGIDIGNGITGHLVNVTPKLAKQWLVRNHPKNRSISWSRVESFANDIRSGHFKITHQGICFDAEGYVIDGQHRLHAIVQADMPVSMLVFSNPESQLSDPIDRSGPRTLAQLLGKRSRTIAALNVLRYFEQGGVTNVPMTAPEAQGVYERHQKDIDRLGSNLTNMDKLQGASVAAFVWTLPCATDAIIAFAQQVLSGEMIRRGDPAYALRSWFENNPGLSGWARAMASINAAWYAAHGTKLTSVYTGDSGFKAVTSRRRALKIPNTPSTDIVSPGNWSGASQSAKLFNERRRREK